MGSSWSRFLLRPDRQAIGAIREEVFSRSGGDLMSIKERVIELILENLDVDPEAVVPEAKFIDDLGVSSMDLWELVLVMEDEFDLEVPDDELEKIITIQDAISFVEKNAGKEA
jgi:acyl carrier protein